MKTFLILFLTIILVILISFIICSCKVASEADERAKLLKK